MDPRRSKVIGAGLACFGMGAAAIGVGNISANFLPGALRNPSAADGQFGRLSRLRRDGSSRHLRAAHRLPAAVRLIRANANWGTAMAIVLAAARARLLRRVGPGKVFPPLDPATFVPQSSGSRARFGLLYLFARVALPRVGEVIEERADRIRRDLEQAKKLKVETRGRAGGL